MHAQSSNRSSTNRWFRSTVTTTSKISTSTHHINTSTQSSTQLHQPVNTSTPWQINTSHISPSTHQSNHQPVNTVTNTSTHQHNVINTVINTSTTLNICINTSTRLQIDINTSPVNTINPLTQSPSHRPITTSTYQHVNTILTLVTQSHPSTPAKITRFYATETVFKGVCVGWGIAKRSKFFWLCVENSIKTRKGVAGIDRYLSP
jgi:alpha-L-arabinofuranosidase